MNYDKNGLEDDFMSLYFLEDDTVESFTRDVLTIIKILEKLGGFLEIVVIISAFLVYPINSFLYKSFLIEKLYLYQHDISKHK